MITTKYPQTLQVFYEAMTKEQREEIKKLLEANRKKPFICKTIKKLQSQAKS